MARTLVRIPGIALLGGMLSLTAVAALEGDAPVVAPDADAATVQALRGDGEAGLAAVMAAYAAEHTPQTETQWRTLIDAVAGQRDAIHGGLYWYTDLDEAQQVAQQTGRPILSLRLLGELTDEYSCANSRFFRTALYSNPDLAALIRDRYVLHWSSERPVPVVTIDFGDGRMMKRTITGNSAHYILDSSGAPLDVLPGMMGPGAFADQLMAAADLHSDLDGLSRRKREAALAQWHDDALDSAITTLQGSLGGAGRSVSPDDLRSWLTGGNLGGDGPEVRQAMNLSRGKMIVETPILEAVVPGLDGLQRGAIEPTDDEWRRIAVSYALSATLHTTSRQLILDEQPLAMVSDELQDPTALFTRFEQSIAEDTARNELSLHARIHTWFAAGEVADFEGLNRRVYDDLFATPATDPWMGLLETDAYTGLSQAGIIMGQ